MIIYKITNKINGKVYIGQTKYSLAHRWHQHCRPTSNCSILREAINKYGKENFSKEIIGRYINQIDLINAEMYYIDYHNCISPNGYNITNGGENPKHTLESRKKLSESKLGPKNPAFGKKQSTETIAKRSAALKGRKRPAEVIAKIKKNHNPISDKNLTYRRINQG